MNPLRDPSGEGNNALDYSILYWEEEDLLCDLIIYESQFVVFVERPWLRPGLLKISLEDEYS